MCFREQAARFSCVLVVPVLITLRCSSWSTDPARHDLRTVSLPSRMTAFSPDSAWTARHYGRSRAPAPAAPAKATATAAKIDPERIEVLVHVKPTYAEEEASWDYYHEFWEDREFQTNRWDYQVAFYESHPRSPLVHHGKLQRNGDYAAGTIQVAEGVNMVLIGFVMPGDTFSLGYEAEYHWNGTQAEDGWYHYQGIDTGGVPPDTLRFDPMYP